MNHGDTEARRKAKSLENWERASTCMGWMNAAALIRTFQVASVPPCVRGYSSPDPSE